MELSVWLLPAFYYNLSCSKNYKKNFRRSDLKRVGNFKDDLT